MKKTILFFFVFVCFFMIWADIKQESETETVNTSNPDKTGTDKMTYIQAEEYCKNQGLSLPTKSQIATLKEKEDACFWVSGEGGKPSKQIFCYNPKKYTYGVYKIREEGLQSVFCVSNKLPWSDSSKTAKQESKTETAKTSNPDKTGANKMTYIQAEEYCKKQELALPTPSKVASDKDLKEVDACFWVTGGGKDKRICYNPKKHSYGRIMRDEDIQSVFCVRDENKKVDGASKRLWD